MRTTRRQLLAAGLAAAGVSIVPLRAGRSQPASALLTKPIPSTGEQLPAVGLGTWITFNVGDDPELKDECAGVMAAFFEAGGRLIDSSPMYGSSQPTIGYGLQKLGHPKGLFSADKVWISNPAGGPGQIAQSRSYWTVPRFDLLQVHNLVSWEVHLPMLLEMKAAGRLRYVGITTSEGRRHDEVERIMASQPIDFVQVTYNIIDREIEQRILPLAQERGIGVIVNRPFQEGHLIRRMERHPLPDWAGKVGASSWAQLILKFIISQPTVTCAIPATSRIDHVQENMAAATEPLPDKALRQRLLDHVAQL
jgi:diketogulonate reductase-like aldo/keto reductase